MKKIIFLLLSFLMFFGCIQKKEKWIFIMAGQSNMAGRGFVEPQDTISDTAIFTLNKEMVLEVAKEPLHFYESNLAGLDCGLSFAKELRLHVPKNVEIVLVPCAVGGSSIDQWLNNSLHRNVKLYSNFKERVAIAKSMGTLKGILWHQGESDAHKDKLPVYQNKLEQLFQNFRTDIGNESLPIIIGELGDYAEPEQRNNNWKALNNILHKMTVNDDNLSIVSSKGLKSNPDKVHFNTEAQRELGKRYAKQYLTILSTKKQHLQFDQNRAKEALQFASKQYEEMIKVIPDTKLPRTTHKDGKLGLVNAPDWTSGFYPGILWYLYEFNQNKTFKSEAIKYTNLLENQKYNASTHDLGFMLYCSYGNGYRITNDSIYKQILLTGAKTLSGRFNEKIGCIKSWDWNPKWQFPVIVDNMMNLEYLFWASKVTKDSTFYKQAISHADVTLKNHFREDNSSVHMIDYDTISGNIIEKITVQGFADESAWARGQAWGLYGYTMMYRETLDLKYVEQANKIAAFIFNHPNMPVDLIPYWDYNTDTIPNAPRDTSAAAIIASALLELSQYVDNDLEEKYLKKATIILGNLTSPKYSAELGKNNNFILKHATGHLPGDKEIDVPLIYADYYYIEALIRYLNPNA